MNYKRVDCPILDAAFIFEELHQIPEIKIRRMAAEDFSEYLKFVCGCYFLIGTEKWPQLFIPLPMTSRMKFLVWGKFNDSNCIF
jgi:hypothetical protein